MRDFIRTYGKLAGLFAGAAFVLSFVTGIAARNPVGTIILRAVLLSALFCGLGVGLQFVVRKFLPELTGAPAAASDEPAPGSRVNAPGMGTVVDWRKPSRRPRRRGRRFSRSPWMARLSRRCRHPWSRRSRPSNP